MHIHADFEDFLKFLNGEQVRFVIVGGYAVAFHGYARATSDMDLFFEATAKNIKGIRRALRRFGIPTTDQQVREFTDPEAIIRMGVPPVRLELINSISGISFKDVWRHKVQGTYGETPVFYMSLPDLLKNKKASGRPKDLADFDELGGSGKA
jgi:hypothetical protein